jgi:lipopolysaccharide export system permease protein
MRVPRTLWFYILRGVLQYTLIGLAAITMVLVTRNMVRMLDWLIGAGFLLSDLAAVLQLLGTMLAAYTLPISFLFGVLLAFGRMAGDVEILAMRACGVGLRQIALPVVIAGALISLFTWKLTLEIEPAARRAMTAAAATMLMRGAVVEPGNFTNIGSRLLYVDERDPEGGLSGVVISDDSNVGYPIMIFAESGEISLNERAGMLTFRLENGDIHMRPPEDPDGLYQRIAFSVFDYDIDVTGVLAPTGKPRAREMNHEELLATIARIEAGDLSDLSESDPITYSLHLHRRFAAPLAPLLFGLVGVPIGMRRKRGARSWGALLCAGVAFSYYMLQSFCEFVAIRGWLPPGPATWIPNLVFAALAIWLLRRARITEV